MEIYLFPLNSFFNCR